MAQSHELSSEQSNGSALLHIWRGRLTLFETGLVRQPDGTVKEELQEYRDPDAEIKNLARGLLAMGVALEILIGDIKIVGEQSLSAPAVVGALAFASEALHQYFTANVRDSGPYAFEGEGKFVDKTFGRLWNLLSR